MKKLIILLSTLFLGIQLFAVNTEYINVTLTDNDTITGKLWLPESNISSVVIFIHGTGAGTYLNKRKFGNYEFIYFDLFAEEYGKRGAALFSYNRRGVTIGNTPPLFENIDSAKFSKYLPITEAEDIESIITRLKTHPRLKNVKIILHGQSEGTIIATLVADRKKAQVDALFLTGYANENLYDIIKWQYSGAASIINIRKYFDTNNDNLITREEYESDNEMAAKFRKGTFQDTGFDELNLVKDSVLDYRDFGAAAKPVFDMVMEMTTERNDTWIWNNYFRITTEWLQEHFKLEPNKTRMLRIEIPIFIFHGTDDANTPIEGVYDIQARFKACSKTNLNCFVFEGHNHDLNYQRYPFENVIPEGLQKIFDTAGTIK